MNFTKIKIPFSSVQFSCSVVSDSLQPHETVFVVQSLSHVQLSDPMDWSRLGSSVLSYLPEFSQIHMHWLCEAIQTSHPLSPPSPLALNLPQPQGLFQWVAFLGLGITLPLLIHLQDPQQSTPKWLPRRPTHLITHSPWPDRSSPGIQDPSPVLTPLSPLHPHTPIPSRPSSRSQPAWSQGPSLAPADYFKIRASQL